LKPDGRMLLQAITASDQRYETYKRSVDFINKYIFPGGCLTSVTGMAQTLTRHTDMRVIHVEDIGPHYALTLRHWYERFMAKLGEVRSLGYSNSFIRMWEFYLASCEAAFAERVTGDVQVLMVRPDARIDSVRY
jgi:cyclopropane-fatty-acyl-phospholipid synthase